MQQKHIALLEQLLETPQLLILLSLGQANE